MKQMGWIVGIVIAVIVYVFPGWGMHTRLDFFVPLSQSFLHGKIYVSEMREELHEMVSQKEIDTGIPEEPVDGVLDKYYVIYPPFPAVLVTPFVAIWGVSTNQSAISVLFSLISIYVAYLVFKELKLEENKARWLVVLYAFGSSVWYHALVGSSWYFASICGMLMLWLAIINYLKKRSFLVTGLLLGLAFLCRFPMILGFVFFVIANKKIERKALLKLLLPLGFCVVLMLFYNFVRYGRIDNYGYKLLESRWYNINYEYSRGSYDLSYIPRHIATYFFGMPERIQSFPYYFPNMHGMAVWLVFPAILVLFSTRWRNRVVKAALLAILLTIPAHFFHGGVGETQFGYRYMFDYLPYIFIILAITISNQFRWWHKLLIGLSLAVNVWGVMSLLMVK